MDELKTALPLHRLIDAMNANPNAIPNLPITGITQDSRQIVEGNLFVAVKGDDTDGRHYIAEAIARGASAVIYEKKSADILIDAVPSLPVERLSDRVSDLARIVYDDPARRLQITGVTGTNGKTTVCHLMACVMKQLKKQCGVLGTLGNGYLNALTPSPLTTLDSITLQAHLRHFANTDADAVAMEVSSHSLTQHRLRGVRFDSVIFTNLTQDHLDYHESMANYEAAKSKLFTEYEYNHAIVNIDDEMGQRLVKKIGTRAISVGIHNQSAAPAITAKNIQFLTHGIRATIITPWGEESLLLPLMGEFNLLNALLVVGALCAQGLPFKKVINALSRVSTVPGRVDQLPIQAGKPTCVVDYAHTPDALQSVLQTLRQHHNGRIWCVFGCGGDRDRAKRPLMAQWAESLADTVIVTDDNPRTEEPSQIFEDIMQGFQFPEKVSWQHDRAQAIAFAVSEANAEDIILVAGKGHETTQQYGDETISFDDKKVLTQCIAMKEARKVI